MKHLKTSELTAILRKSILIEHRCDPKDISFGNISFKKKGNIIKTAKLRYVYHSLIRGEAVWDNGTRDVAVTHNGVAQ